MDAWISKIKKYLKQFIELGMLLIGVSVFAEILFGPDVAFFGSQVTANLVGLLGTLGDSGIAALIVILALMITYRKLLK
jgi:multisubunit Na+/H+ antiporter MnhB subunit